MASSMSYKELLKKYNVAQFELAKAHREVAQIQSTFHRNAEELKEQKTENFMLRYEQGKAEALLKDLESERSMVSALEQKVKQLESLVDIQDNERWDVAG